MNSYTNTSIIIPIFVWMFVYNNIIILLLLQILFVDFSKIVTDTGLKFSAYTYILTGYRMMYYTLL